MNAKHKEKFIARLNLLKPVRNPFLHICNSRVDCVSFSLSELDPLQEVSWRLVMNQFKLQQANEYYENYLQKVTLSTVQISLMLL